MAEAGGNKSNGSSSEPKKEPVGHYLVGDRLGRGAFGDVFKGLDTESGCFVAIKQMALDSLPTAQKREVRDAKRTAAISAAEGGSGSFHLPDSVLKEVSLLKSLDHPNIVRYLNTVVTDTHLNLVLEFIESGSLAQVLDRFGVFPEKLVITYVRQILTGLDFLHTQAVPIAHLDIKAANLLITKDGVIKLADFGISAILHATEPDQPPIAQKAEGSPFWMAPEVILMEGISTKADVWSLGCTIIELLTGHPPYWETSGVTAMFRMVEDEHPPIPSDECSPVCRAFLLECFVKDPLARPSCKSLIACALMAVDKPEKRRDYSGTLSRVRQFNTKRQQSRREKKPSAMDLFSTGGDTKESSGAPALPASSPPRLGKVAAADATTPSASAEVAKPNHQTTAANVDPKTVGAIDGSNDSPVTTPTRLRGRPLARLPDPQQNHSWQYIAMVVDATNRRNFVHAFTVFEIKVCVTFPKDKAGAWQVEHSFGDFKDLDTRLRAALLGEVAGRSPQRSQALPRSAFVNLPTDGADSPTRGSASFDELPVLPQMKFFGKTDESYIEDLRVRLHDYLERLLQLPSVCKHELLLRFLDLSNEGHELVDG